jgi:hypothetical protein
MCLTNAGRLHEDVLGDSFICEKCKTLVMRVEMSTGEVTGVYFYQLLWKKPPQFDA